MKRNNKELDAIIDSTAASIRAAEPDSSSVNDSTARVWARLMEQNTVGAISTPVMFDGNIEGCTDYQSLIPAYLRNELSVARKLLLEDHTGECVPCRRALKHARTHGGKSVVPVYSRPSHAGRTGVVEAIFGQGFPLPMPSVAQWRIAAALIVSFSLIGFLIWQPFGGRGFGGVVQASEGAVYRVADEDSKAVNSGDGVLPSESIRTGREAHAVVRLDDGSTLEMRERSQFSLSERSSAATVNVERGSFIVQMPAENSKTLYVATNDSLTSAKGATFSVASGTKGTRISVISGTATVDANGVSKTLGAGEQFTSRDNLETVPVARDVQWSRDAVRYTRVLDDLQATRAAINSRATRPAVRTSTRLLDLAPADTILYVALPNWSRTISEARTVLQERMNENPALREWWQQRHSTGKGTADGLDAVLGRVREWGEQLKDEIVIAAAPNSNGAPERVLLLSEVKDPARFRAFVAEQIVALTANNSNPPRVRFVDDPATATQSAESNSSPEIFVWLHNDLVAVSPQLATLRDLSARANAAVDSSQASFTSSPFHARLKELYGEGTSLIVAVDLARVMADEAKRAEGKDAAKSASERAAFQQTGFSDARYFIVESKDASDRTMNRAVLTFNGERRGIAAWLAAPAPMGALEFISPDAAMASAFVIKEPSAVVGDLFEFIKTSDPKLWQSLNETQAENGIDIRRDLAAPLGGEFAFAVDGPLLPVPSWKLIFEVNDPARLNATFERLVEKVNAIAAREGKRGFTREQEEAGSQKFYTIKSLDLGLSVNYTYANNYLIMTPSRALLERALRFRDAQTTLLRAPRFVASLPADGMANFSALFYQNLGGVLDPLKRTMRGFGVTKDATQNKDAREALEALDSFSPPALAYARADANSITFAAPTTGGPFGITPSTLLGLPGGLGLEDIIKRGVNEGESGN